MAKEPKSDNNKRLPNLLLKQFHTFDYVFDIRPKMDAAVFPINEEDLKYGHWVCSKTVESKDWKV